MLKSTFIYRGSRYAIASFGNGWAYEIADNSTGERAWLQDDDALIFRERLDQIETAWRFKPMDWIIAEAVDGAPFERAPMEYRI